MSNVHKARTRCDMNPAGTATGCDTPEVHHPFTTADELHGTPCLVCGAPVLDGIGHDPGCMTATMDAIFAGEAADTIADYIAEIRRDIEAAGL